eukprot:2117663-Rhodomonas_salina.1
MIADKWGVDRLDESLDRDEQYCRLHEEIAADESFWYLSAPVVQKSCDSRNSDHQCLQQSVPTSLLRQPGSARVPGYPGMPVTAYPGATVLEYASAYSCLCIPEYSSTVPSHKA